MHGTKESTMRNWFFRLIHEVGTGRALENARRERDETAITLAGLAALEARLAAVYAAQRSATAASAAATAAATAPARAA
jgi:hypothetical protein